MEYKLSEIYNAIDGQIAVYERQLEHCRERGSSPRHIDYVRGNLDGLKLAREVMPTCHLVPPVYNEKAVDKEIKRDPRIKGKEAKAIHRLLKGRTKAV